MMREIVISKIVGLIKKVEPYEHEEHRRQRMNPIKDWLIEEIMHLEYKRSKVQTARRNNINLDNIELILFTANLSDEKVFELYEVVNRRCARI
jgi:hypothetical protein